jgi:hypothetical protein
MRVVTVVFDCQKLGIKAGQLADQPTGTRSNLTGHAPNLHPNR